MTGLDAQPAKVILDDLQPDDVVAARKVIASRARDAADATLIMDVLGIGYDRKDPEGNPL